MSLVVNARYPWVEGLLEEMWPELFVHAKYYSICVSFDFTLLCTPPFTNIMIVPLHLILFLFASSFGLTLLYTNWPLQLVYINCAFPNAKYHQISLLFSFLMHISLSLTSHSPSASQGLSTLSLSTISWALQLLTCNCKPTPF